jgi:hypothetical protein
VAPNRALEQQLRGAASPRVFKDLRVTPPSRTKLLGGAGQGVERPIHQLEELLLPCRISEGLKWRSRPAAVAFEGRGIGKLLVALDSL